MSFLLERTPDAKVTEVVVQQEFLHGLRKNTHNWLKSGIFKHIMARILATVTDVGTIRIIQKIVNQWLKLVIQSTDQTHTEILVELLRKMEKVSGIYIQEYLQLMAAFLPTPYVLAMIGQVNPPLAFIEHQILPYAFDHGKDNSLAAILRVMASNKTLARVDYPANIGKYFVFLAKKGKYASVLNDINAVHDIPVISQNDVFNIVNDLMAAEFTTDITAQQMQDTIEAVVKMMRKNGETIKNIRNISKPNNSCRPLIQRIAYSILSLP